MSRDLVPLQSLPWVWSQKQGSLPLANSMSTWDKGARGHGEGLVGAIKAASELGKALPELQGNSLVSSLPTSKGG